METKQDPRRPAARLWERLRAAYGRLERERLPQLLLYVTVLVLGGGLLVFLAEAGANRQMFSHLFDSIWWTVVTIATVGYGDKYPVTTAGRVLGIVIILLGVVAVSTLSGTIASIFVDRKMREGRGLQNLVLKGHTLVLGWNEGAERVLECLQRLGGAGRHAVALVNELDPEEFQAVRSRRPELDLRFVRGDFCNESILRRAAVPSARAAIVLSDTSGRHTLDNADERTILASLALKSLNAGLNISAELHHPDNEPHLRRANVEDILVNGEFNGFLLASATRAPALPQVARELLSTAEHSQLRQVPVPAAFVGRSFRELGEHFLRDGSVLIGILVEEKKVSLDDILSEGSPAIDAFIKQKFAEAELDVLAGEREELAVRINPGAEYRIQEHESAVVIGGRAGRGL